MTRHRVLHGDGPSYTPDFLLEDIAGTGKRRFTNFSGDVSGRWIGALAVSSQTFGDRFERLDEVVHRAIALQHPDGYFGRHFSYDHPSDDDLALLWGNGRLLTGLVEYYKLSHDAATLASAKQLGEFLLSIAPKYNSKAMANEFDAEHFASSYICWMQQTEGLALLYAAIKDERYARLCEEIGDRAEARPADHVHGFLCSLRGTMMLYEATRKPRLLAQVEEKWSRIQRSGDVLITGGVPEAWTPAKRRTEGCAECDWLRLNLALWKATGNMIYIDAAEKTLFNEFAMNQFATGDFGHANLDGNGVPQQVMVRAWWCCTLHGMRAFADIATSAFLIKGDALQFVLPIDSSFRSGGVALRSTSTLATDGRIDLRVEQAAGHRLTIREPSWAKSVSVTLNGRKTDTTDIVVRTGDRVQVRYEMSAGEVTVGKGPSRAFTYGPWLLGAASAQNAGYFNELYADNVVLAETLAPMAEHIGKFSVPIAARNARYLPTEFPEQPSLVNLHPVAEQTAMPSTPWQIAFHTTPQR